MLRRTGFLAVLLSVLALLVFQVSPAFAHHKDDHEGGQGAQQVERDSEDDGDNDHPSGNDRSVESGGSGNQGNSESDPDDDGRGPDRSNGGPDKPNGSGGEDLADQDGNNGCGNDDDFEDDNEGWCGKPTETDDVVEGAREEICVEGEVMANGETCDDTIEGDEVAGDIEVREDDAEVADDSVLGTRLNRAPAAPAAVAAAGVAAAPGGALPFTGAALVPFVIAGLGMIGTGIAIARRRS